MHNNSQIRSNFKKKCCIYNMIRTQIERNFHNITHLVQPKSTASIKNSCHLQLSNANRNFGLFVNSLTLPCTQNKIIKKPSYRFLLVSAPSLLSAITPLLHDPPTSLPPQPYVKPYPLLCLWQQY